MPCQLLRDYFNVEVAKCVWCASLPYPPSNTETQLHQQHPSSGISNPVRRADDIWDPTLYSLRMALMLSCRKCVCRSKLPPYRATSSSLKSTVNTLKWRPPSMFSAFLKATEPRERAAKKTGGKSHRCGVKAGYNLIITMWSALMLQYLLMHSPCVQIMFLYCELLIRVI